MNNNTIEFYETEIIHVEIQFGQENILYFNGPTLILEFWRNCRGFGLIKGMLCQVNIFGGTLQGFIKSIDGKILILRMVDVEHKNLKKGRYTYVRDEKTESRIKKELKDNGL